MAILNSWVLGATELLFRKISKDFSNTHKQPKSHFKHYVFEGEAECNNKLKPHSVF